MSKEDLEGIDLNSLTPEERAALEDDDETTDPDRDGDADGGDDDAGGDDADGGDADAGGDDAGGDGTDDETGGEEEEEDTTGSAPEDFTPTMAASETNLDDLKGKVTAIDQQITDLDKAFEDGDIDAADYNRDMRKLERERSDANTEVRLAEQEADFVTRQRSATAQQRWEWEQDKFFAEPANQAYNTNQFVRSALNEAVKTVAREDAFRGKSGADVLAEADRRVREVMVVGAQPADTGKTPKTPKKTPDRSALPRQMGHLPSAAENETGAGDGEFAAIDALEGDAYQAAIDRLTPDQRARYEAQI